MGSRKIRLQMTPGDICLAHKQAKDPYTQIAILAELNGVRDRDIRDILIDNGRLEGTVSADYSKGNIYVDGKKFYPDEPMEEKEEEVSIEVEGLEKQKEPKPRLAQDLKDLIREDLKRGLDPDTIASHRKTSKTNVYRIRKDVEKEEGFVINAKSIRHAAVEANQMEQLHREAERDGYVSKEMKEQMDSLQKEWELECMDCLEMIQLFLKRIRTKHPSHETKESLKKTIESMIGDLFDHVPDHLLSRKEEK